MSKIKGLDVIEIIKDRFELFHRPQATPLSPVQPAPLLSLTRGRLHPGQVFERVPQIRCAFDPQGWQPRLRGREPVTSTQAHA